MRSHTLLCFTHPYQLFICSKEIAPSINKAKIYIKKKVNKSGKHVYFCEKVKIKCK